MLALLVREGAVTKGALADARLADLDRAVGGLLLRCAHDEEFKGAEGQQLSLHSHGKAGAQRILVLGMGPERDRDRTLDQLRAGASRAVKAAKAAGAKTLALAWPWAADASFAAEIQAAAEGATLGAYVFDRYKKEKKPLKLTKVQLLCPTKPARAVLDAKHLGCAIADAVNGARDLVNEPAGRITPRALAAEAKNLAREHGLDCQVLSRAQIKKLGMNLFLAVAQGSAEEPQLVRLSWEPKRASAKSHVAPSAFSSGGLRHASHVAPPAFSSGGLRHASHVAPSAFSSGGLRHASHVAPPAFSSGGLRHASHVAPPAFSSGGLRHASHVALVGKAITFDSGGLSLKTAQGMEDMKVDMAGAAAVMAAMRLVAFLKPPFPVRAYFGACENLPSGTAYKPGDVIAGKNGTTVEVLNTDAEGRLVLGDVLAWAVEEGAGAVIDLATLTGAVLVALGPWTAGLFSNDEALAEELLAASRTAGEPVWRLPLPPEMEELIKSPIADLKNTGGRYGGSINAALFLQHFIRPKGKEKSARPVPWAHIDIAGPASVDRERGYNPRGATGAGVRLLAEWLRRRAGAGAPSSASAPRVEGPGAARAPSARRRTSL